MLDDAVLHLRHLMVSHFFLPPIVFVSNVLISSIPVNLVTTMLLVDLRIRMIVAPFTNQPRMILFTFLLTHF